MSTETNENKNDIKTSIIFGLSLVGLCAAITENDACIYEVVSYVCDQYRIASPRWYVYLVLLGGHITFWAISYHIGKVPKSELARGLLPLTFLCGHFITLFLKLNNSFWSLYATEILIGLSAFLVVSRWKPLDWSNPLSTKVATGMAVLLCMAFVSYSIYFQEYMYSRMLLGYPDIGIYFKRIANFVYHGAFHQVDSETLPYSYHFAPGLALLIPFFLISPAIHFFIFIQSFFIGVTGLVLFYIGIRRGLKPILSLGVALCFYLFPATSQLTYNYSYGFHSPSIALPFLVLSIYLIDGGKYWKALVPTLIAVSMQEYIVIYFIGAGGAWILAKRFMVGSLCIFLGSIYFFGIVKTIMPAMPAVGFWAPLGDSMAQIAMSPFLQPKTFLSLLASPHNFHLILNLLLPLCFFPLLAPRLIVTLIPIVLFNCLRPALIAKSIAFQYQTGTIGILFLALVFVASSAKHNDPCIYPFSNLARTIARRLRPSAIVAAAVAVSFVANLHLGLLPWSRSGNIVIIPKVERLEANYQAFQDIQKIVPQTASVTGDLRTMAMFLNNRLVIELETRPDIQTDYHVYQEEFFGTAAEETVNHVNKILSSKNYELIYNQHHCYVLKRILPLPPLPDTVF